MNTDNIRLSPSDRGGSLTVAYALFVSGRFAPVSDIFDTRKESLSAQADQADATNKMVVLSGDERRVCRLVPRSNLPRLEEGVKKLSRKASRLGLDPAFAPSFTVHGSVDLRSPSYGEDGVRNGWRWSSFAAVEITCAEQFIQLDGWQLAGRIDHLVMEGGENTNMVSLAPWLRGEGGPVIPSKYRGTSPVCEHCNTARRRLSTFLVYSDEEDAIRQVGRNCLADYIGEKNAQRLLERSQFEREVSAQLEDWLQAGSAGTNTFLVEEYLAWVAKSIREDGWLSRGAAYERGASGTATADLAFQSWAAKRIGNSKSDEIEPPIKDDVQRAASALAWATGDGIPEDTTNDYLWNLKAATSVAVLHEKAHGIVASLVSAYDRAMSNIQREKRATELAETSSFIGQPGDKFGKKLTKKDKDKGASSHPAVTVTVDFMRDMESDWGTNTLVKMVSTDGDIFQWFASNASDASGNRIEVGKTYTLAGTLKAHTEYRGTKQNKVIRCKLEPTNQPPGEQP